MGLALLTCTFCSAAAAREPESAGARYQAEVRQVLGPLMRQHGPDAVNLQGNLLRFAIDNGSLLEASVGISGIRERDGIRYLVYELDTGMVFRESDTPAHRRPRRVWSDVIQPSLRACKRLDLRADGIEIHVLYRYSDFADRADLARRVTQGSVPTETVTFAFNAADARSLSKGSLSEADFLRRARIERNGSPIELDDDTPTPPPN